MDICLSLKLCAGQQQLSCTYGVLCTVNTSVHSRFAMLDFMQDPPSFGSEELFSVPTSDLCKSLTNAPSVSASQAMRCLH
jgi:hypothetical protein